MMSLQTASTHFSFCSLLAAGIEKWLVREPTCPLCRARVTVRSVSSFDALATAPVLCF